MNDLSRLSWQELIALYAERELDLEALAAEVQRRQDMAKKRWDTFIEEVRKFVDHARQLASNFLNAWRTSILIQQYEKEIQRVETLLKYTKHSKKRQEHERYLKWLRKQVDELKRGYEG
jgi:hypothetical protein